ncbi:MAG: hypothetical protein GXN98_01980 [Euryarchaeota archaeon]|nr:hypothetical protein [Euryarchaeota archaeon]
MLMSRAELVFVYGSSADAELVAELLELDNRLAKGKLKVKTEARGEEVVSVVEHPELHTLFATVADLLFCEKLISEMLEV